MKEECITAVRKAAGELKLSDADIEHIEFHIREAWEFEGSKYADFSNLSLDQQINRVGNRAKQSFFSDSSRLKPYELLAGLQEGKDLQTYHLKSQIAHQSFGGGSVEASIGQYKRVINDKFAEYRTYGSKFAGFVNDPKANRELMLALRGDKNVRPEAVKLAKTFHDNMDYLVKEAEVAGIKFHPLENYTPQPMDFRKISTVTKEEFVERTIPRLDLVEYQRRGIKDAESLRSFVGDVYETLASEGRNKVIAGSSRSIRHGGFIGGRLRQPRQLHYTPEGLASAMEEFGSEVTIDGMMGSSFNNLIRDIAVAREFGANASENFEFVLASTYERDRKSITERHKADDQARDKALKRLEREGKDAKDAFDRLTRGKEPSTITDQITDLELAWQVVVKFGTQVLYVSVDAVNSIVHASKRVGTSWKQTVSDTWSASPIARLTAKEKREFINHIAVGIDHARTGLSHDLETNSRSFVGKMAQKALDWQGLTAMDNMIVRGLSASLQNYVGKLTRNFKDMTSLKKKIGEQSFYAIVETHRFSERDLKLLSLAEPESFNGKGTYLTDKNIYNIADEHLTPFLKTGENAYTVKSNLANKYRTLIWSTVQDHARGSVGATLQDTKLIAGKGLGGNVLRLMSQFMVMPISFVRTHLLEANRGFKDGVGANVYRAQVAVLSLVTEELIRNVLIPLIYGKEPRFDITDPLDYAKAVLNAVTHFDKYTPLGGKSAGDTALNVLGSAPASTLRLASSVYDAIKEDKPSKQPKANAKMANELLNYFIPYQNLWYVKGAFDHYIRNSLADIINPGGRERAELYRKKQNEREKRYR
ncbi:hypothetical protein [Candidatus Liberibacter americanus]|uniref:Uncharacterized protein n=1 Tax=Candidatus Liberibacter americanus str. Sao Paulo TaxID=1261131 RepID=U6B558_9HYPH|nr:hypothetical protein [Candidatus Liberibacter americanus]AHA28045.1 hypothetical protein lam_699 [Candidatus Liberibacter americanus str. Sao Paulo]EMS35820.1 hypothetical protein G653_04726 [Candidatus Liberibacter americanus PW_SP]